MATTEQNGRYIDEIIKNVNVLQDQVLALEKQVGAIVDVNLRLHYEHRKPIEGDEKQKRLDASARVNMANALGPGCRVTISDETLALVADDAYRYANILEAGRARWIAGAT